MESLPFLTGMMASSIRFSAVLAEMRTGMKRLLELSSLLTAVMIKEFPHGRQRHTAGW